MLALARLGVATRPGFPRCRARAAATAVLFFEFEPVPVSSREIRALVARGEPIDGLVPPASRPRSRGRRPLPRLDWRRHEPERLTDTTRASTPHRRARPGEAGQGRRHPGHDAGVHVHRLLRHLHGPEPAADEGDLRRGAQGAEGRVAARCPRTTDVGEANVDRRRLPRRGAARLHAGGAARTTRWRICGATCLRSRSRPSRPRRRLQHGPRMTSWALHWLGPGP